MDAWVMAADLAGSWRIPIGTIYYWASQDHWRRTRDWPRRYSLADAQQSLERRRPPRQLDQ